MRKLEIKNPDLVKMAVQEEIARSDESRYDHKLHGVLLATSGLSCYEIADLLGHSPRTVQTWIKKFDKSGFAGLEETPRPGRPRLLSEADIMEIGHDLRISPRDLGYNQNLWDGKLLSHHLVVKFGVNLGVRQCQRLFHKLDFRRRKPRPFIAKADPDAQRRYKKTPQAGDS